MIMKRIILSITLLVSILIINDAFTQEQQLSKKDKKKLEKEEKKKQKEAAELVEWNEAKAIAESKRFVFTAFEVFTEGGSIALDERTNFFYVLGDDATLQTAVPVLENYPNPNGIGGVTTEGKVTSYKVKNKGPKKPISIQVAFKPLAGQGGGIHTFVVFIYGDGYAELQFPYRSTRLKGNIRKPENSKIYKGTHL